MHSQSKKVSGLDETESVALNAGEGILIADNTVKIDDSIVAKDSDIVTLSAGDGIDIADSVVKIDSTVAKKTDIVTLSTGGGILIADNTVTVDSKTHIQQHLYWHKQHIQQCSELQCLIVC